GYDPTLSSGTICAGGTLGLLIPPSIMLIVYGPMAGVSVGKLFLAAVGPGLLLALLYALYILVLSRLRPERSPVASREERTLTLPQKL
ncbi:TRAP transporter large permease subunit, partial [Staphylococcus aureus]|uniref:TRAP transporter large permease subunit n=1 Tax=Staphylococcus aureus TaxID=1280 RepID=UPI003FA7B563